MRAVELHSTWFWCWWREGERLPCHRSSPTVTCSSSPLVCSGCVNRDPCTPILLWWRSGLCFHRGHPALLNHRNHSHVSVCSTKVFQEPPPAPHQQCIHSSVSGDKWWHFPPFLVLCLALLSPRGCAWCEKGCRPLPITLHQTLIFTAVAELRKYFHCLFLGDVASCVDTIIFPCSTYVVTMVITFMLKMHPLFSSYKALHLSSAKV